MSGYAKHAAPASETMSRSTVDQAAEAQKPATATRLQMAKAIAGQEEVLGVFGLSIAAASTLLTCRGVACCSLMSCLFCPPILGLFCAPCCVRGVYTKARDSFIVLTPTALIVHGGHETPLPPWAHLTNTRYALSSISRVYVGKIQHRGPMFQFADLQAVVWSFTSTSRRTQGLVMQSLLAVEEPWGAVKKIEDAIANLERRQAPASEPSSINSMSAELESLAKLHKNGVLTDAQFEEAKNKVIGARA